MIRKFAFNFMEVKAVKRLLSFVLIAVISLTVFASCAKMKEDTDGSDSGSDSDIGASSELFESDWGEYVPNVGGDVISGESTDVPSGDSSGSSDEEKKPDVKDSTSGLKFTLNADGKSYTLVGKGSASATTIFVDGYKGLPVTRIGYGAFANDEKITEIKIGDSVEVIENFAFSMCKKVTKLTFGKNVKRIGEYSFRYCTSMTTADLGDSLEFIDDWAFYNSGALMNITMPNTLRSVGEGAFDKTGYSKDSGKWSGKALYIGKHLVSTKSDISGKYTVADGTVTIAKKAFSGRSSLTEVVIPNSVKGIGAKAFERATKLATVSIGTGVEFIGEKAFENSKYYNTSGNWKNNVLYIGNYLVDTKTALGGICTVTSGTKVIADMAFESCENLSSVVIPDSAVYLGEYAFRGCPKLTSVTIGSGVKKIGIYAFKDCSKIESVTFKDPTGWKAGDVTIASNMLATKQSASNYLALLYSGVEWVHS